MSKMPPSSTTNHTMKTTKRGRPFLKDTLDLFATLVLSLSPTTHKQFFRTFPNSFTTEEAVTHLSHLKFSQSGHAEDPNNPGRFVTTTTTTTFSMTRDMGKSMCQHFMDARLIENSADLTSNVFKERGVYVLTPKGVHVLERFMSKNGVQPSPEISTIFDTQPICIKLLHVERRPADDEVIISTHMVDALFKRFAGLSANYLSQAMLHSTNARQTFHERSKGMPVMDYNDRAQAFKNCFYAVPAMEWICDFTSLCGRDEAAEMMAHFVRFEYITLVSDKRRSGEPAVIFTVRAGNGGAGRDTGDFRCTSKAIYRITEQGANVAGWGRARPSQGGPRSPDESTANLSGRPSTEENASTTDLTGGDAKIRRRISMAEKLRGEGKADGPGSAPTKESNTDRLRHILDEPALRSLFREFLRNNFCEENLSFWLDVQDFKKRFHTTSSVATVNTSKKTATGQNAMEKHHESLITMAFVIYNTYLAPSSPCELNIDHALRNELVAYLNEVLTRATGKAFQGRVEPEQAQSFNTTQLYTMIRLYERIQTHVFRLMATDSVPKFIKTSEFVNLRNWVENVDGGMSMVGYGVTPVSPPGLGEGEHGRTYMSISAAAHERKKEGNHPNIDSSLTQTLSHL